MANLVVKPGHVANFKEFYETKDPFCIGVDGFFPEDYAFYCSLVGPYLSLNHHSWEPFQMASCAKLFQGMRDNTITRLFQLHTDSRTTLFTNDSDQDCASCWAILNNPKIIFHSRTAKLIDMQSRIDASGGTAGNQFERKDLEQGRWIYLPYSKAREDGSLYKKDSAHQKGIILEIEERFMAHIRRKGGSLPLETDYTVIGGIEKLYRIIEEGGADFRLVIPDDAYVSFKPNPYKEGRFYYSIIRKNPLIVWFDPLELITLLNLAEAKKRGVKPGKKYFDGGTLAAGCRNLPDGSVLTPPEVNQIVEKYVCDKLEKLPMIF